MSSTTCVSPCTSGESASGSSAEWECMVSQWKKLLIHATPIFCCSWVCGPEHRDLLLLTTICRTSHNLSTCHLAYSYISESLGTDNLATFGTRLAWLWLLDHFEMHWRRLFLHMTTTENVILMWASFLWGFCWNSICLGDVPRGCLLERCDWSLYISFRETVVHAEAVGVVCYRWRDRSFSPKAQL